MLISRQFKASCKECLTLALTASAVMIVVAIAVFVVFGIVFPAQCFPQTVQTFSVNGISAYQMSKPLYRQTQIQDNANMYLICDASGLVAGCLPTAAQMASAFSASVTTAPYNLFVVGGNGTATGAYNTALGMQSLASLTTGAKNTAGGFQAMNQLTTGNENTAFGQVAMQNLTTGSNNNAFGWGAEGALTTGSNNNAFGNATLSQLVTGSSNTAFGDGALQITTTSANTATGANALALDTTGTDNVADGYFAGYNLTTGSYNTLLGWSAGQGGITASSNVAIGYDALYAANSGGNTAIGVNALNAMNGGANNVSVGAGSGPTCVFCVNVALLGYGADVSSNAASYRAVVGSGARGTVDNSVTLGRAVDTVVIPGVLNSLAAAPSGSCTVVGWVLSNDGHATFCNGTTWTTKI